MAFRHTAAFLFNRSLFRTTLNPTQIKAFRALNSERFNWDSAPPSTPGFRQPTSRASGSFATSLVLRSVADIMWSVFRETASGMKANRSARVEVIKLAQARHMNAILVTELSRWGRSTQDRLDTPVRLSASGCRWSR